MRNKNSKRFIEENKRISELYNNKNTSDSIMKIVGISPKTLRKRLNYLGLPLEKINRIGHLEGVRKRREIFKKKNKALNARILELYRKGNTIVQISNITKKTRCRIGKILSSLGITVEERRKQGQINGPIIQRNRLEAKNKPQNNKILDLYNKGYLIKDISKELNLDINVLTKRLNQLGTNKKERILRGLRAGAKLKARNDISDEVIKDLYLNKKMPTTMMGKKFNCSSTLILGRLADVGIIRRTMEEINKLNPPIGMLGKTHNELARKKMSATRQGISLEEWDKFISREPYGQEWDDSIKRLIRKRDNQVCMNCGVHRERLKRALSVHHINYNKLLCTKENLISLCDKCHSLTTINREYWIKLFQDKFSKLYGYRYIDGKVILNINEIK